MVIRYVLRQITLTAAVTVKIVLHYDNVQIEVKEVYKVFLTKNVILLLPLDDPVLTDFGDRKSVVRITFIKMFRKMVE